MRPEELALAHRVKRLGFVEAAAEVAAGLWRALSRGRLSESWIEALPELLAVVSGAQFAAANAAEGYVSESLAAQQANAAAVATIQPRALAGVASDGRDLASLLYQPMAATLSAVQAGFPVETALAAGYSGLDMMVRTQVSDAGRVADQIAITARPRADGYVRMVVGKTCSRCIILAGRWYAVNAGFDRHPRCDCVHIPTQENVADSLVTRPDELFASMTRAEQDKVFTQSGAQAIRDGADMNQVVNARRHAAGLTPAGNAKLTEAEKRMLRGGRDVGRLQSSRFGGRDVLTTTEGATKRGIAGDRLSKLPGAKAAKVPRLMPESIYDIAGTDRKLALTLLRRFGYIL